VRAGHSQLAVLGALGMTRRQLGHALAWLGSVFAASLLAIGLAAALLLGGVVWRHVSDDLGIVPDVSIPWPPPGLVTALLVAGGIVSATTFDTRQRRGRLANQLRAE
jgi:hypothetical protein